MCVLQASYCAIYHHEQSLTFTESLLACLQIRELHSTIFKMFSSSNILLFSLYLVLYVKISKFTIHEDLCQTCIRSLLNTYKCIAFGLSQRKED
jgi:hypothetical protein